MTNFGGGLKSESNLAGERNSPDNTETQKRRASRTSFFPHLTSWTVEIVKESLYTIEYVDIVRRPNLGALSVLAVGALVI